MSEQNPSFLRRLKLVKKNAQKAYGVANKGLFNHQRKPYHNFLFIELNNMGFTSLHKQYDIERDFAKLCTLIRYSAARRRQAIARVARAALKQEKLIYISDLFENVLVFNNWGVSLIRAQSIEVKKDLRTIQFADK